MNKEKEWLLNEKHGGIESEDYKRDLERLATGEPLAYIIGWIPFLHTKIFLDSKPLIPRPETEDWTSQAIEALKKRADLSEVKILDLCAGSGCIGVSVLKALPHSSVDFAELDTAHHETIKKNVQENGINENRARILGGNLFENVADLYDVILTNPPYIDPKLGERVQQEVLQFEPKEALFGGTKGMELIENILQNAPRFLKQGGVLYIEHEPEQEDPMKKILPSLESHKDPFGVIRFSTYRN